MSHNTPQQKKKKPKGYNNLDECPGNYSKQKEPIPKGIHCVITYVTFLK